MRRLALAAPGVRFSLHVEDRLALQTSGSDDLLSTIAETHGHALAGSLVALGPVEVAGRYDPRRDRRRRGQPPGRGGVTLLVNGRPIYGRGLAIGAGGGLPPVAARGRHPVLLLAIEVDPRRVDVNVHPAKLEVRLRDEREIAAAMAELVRDTLGRRPLRLRWEPLAGRGGPGSRRRELPSPRHRPLGRHLADRDAGAAAPAPDRTGRSAAPAAGG